MAIVVVCSGRSLSRDLGGTILFRDGITIEEHPTLAAAQTRLGAGGVALTIIDKELGGLEPFIKNLRKSVTLRSVSLAVLSRDDFDPAEVELLTAGANGILRLPPTEAFDQKVSQLVAIPPRREVRVPVQIQVEAIAGFGTTMPVVSVNLSPSGMLVESSYDLVIGDDISVSCRLRETSAAVFRATGKIVRRTARNQYGIRFTSILEGEEEMRTVVAATG